MCVAVVEYVTANFHLWQHIVCSPAVVSGLVLRFGFLHQLYYWVEAGRCDSEEVRDFPLCPFTAVPRALFPTSLPSLHL